MSENNPWSDSQNASPAPVKKQGMSGCMLAAIIVGGLGMVCMVLCCGVGIWFFSMVMPKELNTAAEVTAVGRQILNIELPPDFSPDKAITSDNFIYTLNIAEFTHKENKGKLMLGGIKIKIGDPNQAKMQSMQFREPIEKPSRDPIDVKKSENHEIMINGQKVTVVIGEGTDRTTQKAVHTASTEFVSGGQFTFLFLRMDDDIWDEAAVLKMLEDTKAP